MVRAELLGPNGTHYCDFRVESSDCIHSDFLNVFSMISFLTSLVGSLVGLTAVIFRRAAFGDFFRPVSSLEFLVLGVTLFSLELLILGGCVTFNATFPFVFTSRLFGFGLIITTSLCIFLLFFNTALSSISLARHRNQEQRVVAIFYHTLLALLCVLPGCLGILEGYFRDTDNPAMEHLFSRLNMNVAAVLCFFVFAIGSFVTFRFRQQKVFQSEVLSPARRQAKMLFFFLLFISFAVGFFVILYFLVANVPAVFLTEGFSGLLAFFFIVTSAGSTLIALLVIFGHDIVRWTKRNDPVVELRRSDS